MVSKADILGMDFKTIEDWFQYIVDSEINGNRLQAVRLYEELSKTQKSEFLDWMSANMEAEESMQLLRKLTT